MTQRVIVLDDYQDAANRFASWQRLDDIDLVVQRRHISERAELLAVLAGAPIVVAMRERTPFPEDLLEALPDLRLLVTTGMANAAIDLDACRRRGIEVRGTQGLRTSTAELTWGLILALVRHLVDDDRTMRSGGWQTRIGFELAGARLGVVGLGNLGAAVARIGQAFGMDVLAWSQHLDAARAAELGVRAVEKDTLFTTSDVVSVHLKLSARTQGVVGARELGLMKPTAFLVNTSRGPLVDEAALVDALRRRRIAGAGLDVFDIEPLPADHPLRTLPNTVLAPHVGYVTEQTYAAWWPQVVDDIAAWRAGEALRLLT